MKYHLYLAPVLLVTFAVISMIRCQIYQHKLMKYLREHHTEKWKYLTSLLGSGPGYVNSFRALPGLLDKDDLGDPEVLRLKVITRNSALYVLTGFVSAFISFGVIVLLSQKL